MSNQNQIASSRSSTPQPSAPLAVYPAFARRAGTAVVLIPLALGWLCLQGEERSLYGTGFGEALVAVSNAVVLAALIWWSGWRLQREQIERQGAEAALRQKSEEKGTTVRLFFPENNGLHVASL